MDRKAEFAVENRKTTEKSLEDIIDVVSDRIWQYECYCEVECVIVCVYVVTPRIIADDLRIQIDYWGVGVWNAENSKILLLKQLETKLKTHIHSTQPTIQY